MSHVSYLFAAPASYTRRFRPYCVPPSAPTNARIAGSVGRDQLHARRCTSNTTSMRFHLTPCITRCIPCCIPCCITCCITRAPSTTSMRSLPLVGARKTQVSFAKELYKRDDILPKSPIFLRSLLIIATSYIRVHVRAYCVPHSAPRGKRIAWRKSQKRIQLHGRRSISNRTGI